MTGGARNLPERQQTLRSAIDWSYNLLDEGERMLFRRLAVFAGGCTLESAEAVCNADSDLPFDMLDSLAALVDKSLLRQIEDSQGETRFVMLETIREFAGEHLRARIAFTDDDIGEAGDVQTAHRQHRHGDDDRDASDLLRADAETHT